MSNHRIRYRRLTLYCGIAAAFVLVAAPLYLLVKYSISDPDSINTGGAPIPLWPYSPTLRTFAYLFSDSEFYGVVLNSLCIALATVMLSLSLGVPASYVLGRYRLPGRKIFTLGLISIRLFPDISSVIPVTEFFIRLGAQNTYWGIILAHTLLALPYVIFIGISAFESIPNDLEEQATVMGASRAQAFVRILLPLAGPGLVAAAIYAFLLSWDEFIFAYFLLGLGRISTLTLYLNQKMSFAPPQNILATISVCLSIPVVLFAVLLQKYMTAGITSGSVK
ncbi:MAG: ABC transporter permease subunit [Chitinivibrionales bacterium]|nr:ABC transporter permease subunit [Chitinivibrionales bacterium]MBD3395701.1 ABC transporter permease subunit [Chitinivibrionales bacterium]